MTSILKETMRQAHDDLSLIQTVLPDLPLSKYPLLSAMIREGAALRPQAFGAMFIARHKHDTYPVATVSYESCAMGAAIDALYPGMLETDGPISLISLGLQYRDMFVKSIGYSPFDVDITNPFQRYSAQYREFDTSYAEAWGHKEDCVHHVRFLEKLPTILLSQLITLLNDSWRLPREQIADIVADLGY